MTETQEEKLYEDANQKSEHLLTRDEWINSALDEVDEKNNHLDEFLNKNDVVRFDLDWDNAPNTITFIHPITKFLSPNILKSIIGYFVVSSLIIKRIKQVIDTIVAILISAAYNQSNLEPSCNIINKDNKAIANNAIP